MPEPVSEQLTRAQRRVLRDLSAGGVLLAALRRSDDYVRDDVLFSEMVGIVVHPADRRVESRYRVRNHTAAPLYLAEPSLIAEENPEVGGLRAYLITEAGRAALKEEGNG